MDQLRMADVAERVFPIETAAPAGRPADIGLGAALAASPSAAMFGARRESASVSCWELRDVVLYSGLMMLLKGGRGVEETRYMVHPTEWDAISGGQPREPERRAPDGVRVVIGANRNFRNHYHFVAQALPAVDHALRAPSDLPLAVALPDGWGSLHDEALRLLGHGGASLLRLEPHVSYLLPRARYAEFLCGRTAFDVSCAARETFARLAAGVRDVPTARDLLYVSRADSKYRRLLNEDAVIELMRGLGASVVECGQLTLAQQVNLFRNARVVVGPHGAGLSNIAFCRPGTIVYELIPDGYPNCCYNALAQGGGLAWRGDMFPALPSAGADVHDTPWTAAPDVVERRMAGILEEDRARPASRPALSFA